MQILFGLWLIGEIAVPSDGVGPPCERGHYGGHAQGSGVTGSALPKSILGSNDACGEHYPPTDV